MWADDYDVTYSYSDLKDMFGTGSSYEDASSYWKVPASAGNTATIAIPITNQPTSNITITFNIACFGSGTNPSSSNTTITADGTETGSNWNGSGVSTYPSSSSYVNGVMTITKPTTPTTLEGLTITMGVNTGIKIFRLKSVRIQYTYAAASIATPTFSVAEGTYTSTQSVELACATTGADIYYTTNGTTPTSSSTPYTSAISVSSTTTIKAIAIKGEESSNVGSATYTIYPVTHAGTSSDPYTVADARNAIDANTGLTGVYVTGIVCEGGSELASGAMNYWISDDGTETNKFEIYKGKGISGASFTATTDVKEGDVVVVTGDIKKYGTVYEFNSGSTLVSLVPSVTPLISVGSTSLTGFTYSVGSGPSEAQTFTVEGGNLTDDITLSLGGSSNYEMSLTEGSGYTNSLTLSPTTGTVAETTIYVRLKADLDVNASYEGTITLTSTDATDKSVSLAGSVTTPNFTWDLSTNSYSAASEDQVTWTDTHATMVVDKGTATTNANNYLPTTQTSSRFYKNSLLTITAASGYSITSIEFTATTAGYATALSSTTSTWTNASAAASSTTVTVTPTNGQAAISATIGGTCGFTAVKVYYEAIPPVNVTITAATWASFSSASALDFTDTGVTAYIAKAKDASTVTLTEITKVPANTGIVVNAAAAGTYPIPVLSSEADATTGNLLQPWLTAGEPTETTYYTLAVDGSNNPKFKLSSGGTLAAGKAYLVLGSGARELGVDFGETTGIDSVTRETLTNGKMYNLQGQEVRNAKGIVIVNGKKVIIK